MPLTIKGQDPRRK